jgi:Dyp-type peroxidase family
MRERNKETGSAEKRESEFTMQKFLTLTLPLKQDAASQEKLAWLQKEVFNTDGFKKMINDALDESEAVYFAQFLVLDKKYIQIITTFDGDDREYAIFFFEKLQRLYKPVYELVEGGPTDDDFNLQNYLSFNEAHKPEPFFRYSAIPDKTLKDITGPNSHSISPAEPTAHPGRQVVSPGGGAHNGEGLSAPSAEGKASPQGGRPISGESIQVKGEKVPDLANVQGLIVRPYKHGYSRHLLLQIKGAKDGRDLLKELRPLVSSAKVWDGQKPSRLLNLSITFNGLNALAVDPVILNGQIFRAANMGHFSRNSFPEEFIQSGGKNPDPTGSAGFTGSSSPELWWEGADPRFDSADIHLILHLYASDHSEMDQFTNDIRALFPANINELLLAGRRTIDGHRLPDSREHFGYKDSISQPKINWPGMKVDESDPDFRDFREFLLGYANLNDFQSAPTGPFAQDGSYLVFQLIQQNVADFNQALETWAKDRLIPQQVGNEDRKEWIAAKLIGRWRSGAPLVETPFEDDPGKARNNNFDFADDPQGHACPYSAHIRVSNPRDQKINPMSRPAPRLIRRGMTYGPPFTTGEKEPVDRGLIGMFICASIDRQYLKLTKWINRNDFSPVFLDKTAQDPIQGNRDLTGAASNFHIPIPGKKGGKKEIVLPNLKSFTATIGAAFCFLPSLRTIEDLGADKYMKP